jgi:hypothetical protein
MGGLPFFLLFETRIFYNVKRQWVFAEVCREAEISGVWEGFR